ncbi:MAG: acyl-CoA thioesterase [Chloroflexota bacterium]
MKRLNEEHVQELLPLFKHKCQSKVQFHQVDSAKVMHNIQYLFSLEWARTLYFEAIGLKIDSGTYTESNMFMVVHSRIDYFNPAKFFEDYVVYTRLEFMKNSSIGFENIVAKPNGTILAHASAVMVHIDPATKKAAPLPDEFRWKIMEYEGEGLLVKK